MIPIIKVLVVDDSALIRQMLTRALAMDPRIEVVGTARDGVEAIQKAKDLAPDVITLDIQMPGLSGVEALPFIIRETDARVIMLTSVDDPETTYEALDAGAVDFIVKPREGVATSLSDLSDDLIKQIKTAYRVQPENRHDRASDLVGKLINKPMPPVKRTPAVLQEPVDRIVALAASTGGQPALERVFSGLSADLPAAFVVVQHLPPGFTSSLVKRLSRVTDIPMVEAAPNAILRRGTCYLAPHGMHMTVQRRGPVVRVSLDDGPTVHGVKPAADPLIQSVAKCCGREAVGVLLSGMGSDGAEGLVAIRGSGGTTIVQDEQSSVVWGMPGAAVRRGAAQYVVPLDEVAAEIRRTVREGSGGNG